MSTTPPQYPGADGGAETGPDGFPRHPGTPAPPPPSSGPPLATAEQPQPIRTAVRLMWAGAAVSLVSLVYSVSTLGTLKDDIADGMRDSDSTVSQTAIDAAYGVAIGFALVVGAMGVLLWLWMAWKNGQGRTWARVVATVLGALNVISVLFTALGGNQAGLSSIFAVINLVLAVVILILLYRKESSAFYAAHSGRVVQ